MNEFDLQVRIDQQRETIGRLQEQIEERDDRIAKLEAQRNVAVELSRCECGAEELCANQVKALKRAEAAEAKLRAVGELQRYTVTADSYTTDNPSGEWIKVGELEAKLKEREDG